MSRVTVEPPRDPSHGDMATNAAMVLAKDAGKKPRELAEAIAEKLRADRSIANVDVAGPGFINLTLKPAAWIEALRRAVAAGARYGAQRHRRRPAGQRRICFGQSDRPDACRPLPRRRVRRRAGQPAGLHRLQRSPANITSTMPARRSIMLARSAYLRYREALGETIGDIPGGTLSGRLSQAGRRGARGANMATR